MEAHEHNPVQHRDGKAPWCNVCKLDAGYNKPYDGRRPKSKIDDRVVDYPTEAKIHVINYVNAQGSGTVLSISKVYVTWFSKTLQNWKAMVSTTVPDGIYYEVTHNGDAGETYIDAYEKRDNVCVSDHQEKLTAPDGYRS